MNTIQRILRIAAREIGILRRNHIYFFAMVVFPLLVTFFFTSLMNDGQPLEMPVGVVDLDNTSTTRSLIRKLDAFESSKVVAHYPSVSEARQAIQRNKIYAFLYLPKGTTSDLLSARQPKVSFYYSMTSVTSGSLLYRDLKTITTLGSAAVGSATMTAKGFTEKQIKTFLQPISIDLHPINNPWVDYNVYLSNMLIPGCLMLFIFLILIGKLLPQTLIFLIIMFAFLFYTFDILGFPHQGGTWSIVLLGLLTVFSAQAFGVFIFGLMPSLRMSMSICSLWAVLSFTTSGTAFPLFAMDSPIEAIAQLFPLRHYYMIYQICVFNGYPFTDAWFNIMALLIFICLPIFTVKNIKKAMLEYVYIP